MHSSRLTLTALVLFLALALYPGIRDVTPTGPKSLEQRLEVARLRAHFDSVDIELRDAKASQLTAAQRAARVTLVGWLRDYREAGTFPRNDRFPDKATPFFRDSRGVLCAMAYLIDRSGRGDLVDRVASTRNNAFIAELASDGELLAWLDSTGLSVAEAARIQPFYGGPIEPEGRLSTGYAVTSIAVGGASVVTLGLNLLAPTRSTGWAGVAAGTAAIIAGSVNMDESGDTEDVATINLIAGSGALVTGIYQLLRPRPAELANTGVSVAPTVTPASGGPRIGLALHTSF